MTRSLAFFALILALLAPAPPARGEAGTVVLATTTSTRDSGLLDELLPRFTRESGLQVKVLALGSGAALDAGRRGEADVLLVHAPEAEAAFMAEGWGAGRRPVMHNDFVVLGPPADPAGVRRMSSSAGAFGRIAKAGALFLSRGDRSGTHERELSFWRTLGAEPQREPWYRASGLGMGETLRLASKLGAYTLSDRGTYLALAGTLALEILCEGDQGLVNRYHVILVDRARWPSVNAAGAEAFAAFLLSPATQRLIGEFGVERYGHPLFFPDAGRKEEGSGK